LYTVGGFNAINAQENNNGTLTITPFVPCLAENIQDVFEGDNAYQLQSNGASLPVAEFCPTLRDVSVFKFFPSQDGLYTFSTCE
jgi:hypothetical protein